MPAGRATPQHPASSAGRARPGPGAPRPAAPVQPGPPTLGLPARPHPATRTLITDGPTTGVPSPIHSTQAIHSCAGVRVMLELCSPAVAQHLALRRPVSQVLLRVPCLGRDFTDRRDAAILRCSSTPASGSRRRPDQAPRRRRPLRPGRCGSPAPPDQVRRQCHPRPLQACVAACKAAVPVPGYSATRRGASRTAPRPAPLRWPPPLVRALAKASRRPASSAGSGLANRKPWPSR